MARPPVPSRQQAEAAQRAPLPLPALAVLFSSGLANFALAIYQWRELLVLRAGGQPACAINETLNCSAVWNTPFAAKMHDFFHMPVAGLGVVWAGAATLLAVAIFLRARRGDASAPSDAAKLWSLAGLLSTVMLATAAFRTGAVCLTCLGTYALVGAYAFGALKLLPGKPLPSTNALGPALGWVMAVGAFVFLFTLPKGLQTPKETTVQLSSGTLAELSLTFDAMTPQDLMIASVARYKYQTSTARDASAFPTRLRLGSANAAVAITEWTDIKCGHCRHLEGVLADIRRLAAPTALSVESRHFPIDGECNPVVNKVWGDGVRCLAAKVQICMESSAKYWELRRALFDNAEELTAVSIIEIGAQYGVTREALAACVQSEETKKKLADDIAYAQLYEIQGTPLVLVNGKETLPSGPFLLGLALARGDADNAVFKKLPPPPLD